MASSSFKKIGAAIFAYASAVNAATQSYQVTEEYTTDNFFDKFDFFVSTYTDGDSWDPTHGFVQYRSQADAESLGLINTNNGQIYIGADSNSTYDPSGKGRDSVRITSKNSYNGGLMIAKFAHMPVQACGAWPAFWSYASPWLTTGEIDFYEGWNLMGYNRIAMHVNETLAGECTLSSTSLAGTVMTDDCNNDIDGSGCGVHDSTNIWGSTTGGTFAWEWTDSAIKIWTWVAGSEPSDVTAGAPVPGSSSWGEPQLLVEQSNCDLTKAFGDLQLTFNIDFCGDTAGTPSIWNSTCSAQGSSCTDYVANNPSAFAETYFSIDSIKFFQLQDVVVASSSASSSSVSSSTVAPATTASITTQSGLPAGTGSVLESTLTPVTSSTHAADAAAAAATTSFSHSTSYIYGTSTSTDENGAETTVVVVVDTTICPVTASEASLSSKLASESSVAANAETNTPASAVPAVTSTQASTSTITSTSSSTSTQYTTSTIFSTSASTITSCASTASACTTGEVTTVVVAVSTTICPVTATEGSSSVSASASKASTAIVASSSPAGVSGAGSSTSENSAQQATAPGSSSGTTASTTGTKTTVSSTLKSTVTQSSAVTLVTATASTSSASSSPPPGSMSGTEVETATDTAGALETASGTPTGSYNYGGGNGTFTGVPSSTNTAASSANSCSGLDCVVVSSSGHKTPTGTSFGASGFALAVFAGAMLLL